MIKNSVFNFIWKIRAKNYVPAFWYEMRKKV